MTHPSRLTMHLVLRKGRLLKFTLFPYTTLFRSVCIHIRVISNSQIGIKVECLYQFTNKCCRILCLRHLHFLFVCSLSNLQLVTIRTNVSKFPTKMTHPSRLTMHLVLRKGRLLKFRFFKSTLIFLDGETSMGLTTSLTGGLTISLTTSLIKGSEEDEGI